MGNISVRIKNKRKELKYTQRDIAESLNVTPTTVSQWERAITEPKGTNLVLLANKLQTTPEWITGDSANNKIQFSRSGDEASTLVNYYKNDNKKEALSNRVLKNKNIKNIRLYEMLGNSMSPLIQDKSIISIDMGVSDIIDGKIYLIEHGDIERIRVLSLTPTGINLHSYNDDYQDEHVRKNEIKILGIIYWISNEV